MADPAEKVVPFSEFLKARQAKGEAEADWETPPTFPSSSSDDSNLWRSFDSGATELELGETLPRDFSVPVYPLKYPRGWSGLGSYSGNTLDVPSGYFGVFEPAPISRIVHVNSLGSRECSLKRPIHVEVIEEEEGVTASFNDVNLYGFGKTETAALNALKEQVVDLYEQVNSEEKLGPLPRQWKLILDELIECS